MVPHTSDGRLMFALPWHGHTVVGTTDTPIDGPSYEPRPYEEEIDFILETAARYLTRPPRREDILSIYAGIRPLVKVAGNNKTSALSRDHTIHIDDTGLLTIVGGKWTTYRHMAEDCVNHAITLGDLRDVPCMTFELRVHGYHQHPESLGALAVYGTDAAKIQALAEKEPALARRLHPELPYIAAEVVWAVRQEMARRVEDVLARRTRALILNARAAIAMAPEVARLMAAELNQTPAWERAQVESFTQLAAQYLPTLAGAGERGTE
jgi:glycerol-3-phosphate dehydrogenase